jgi:integrase
MATYGLGAGEITHLDLDDIDWNNRTLRVRRPKTGVETILPLLPPVARALAAYIERERPRHAVTRGVFVTKAMPHECISTSSSLLYLIRKHGRAAGIEASHVGSHALRHSHACRQVDRGANPKVVGDILGHRDPSSLSAYVRVALGRLRQVTLPVPR